MTGNAAGGFELIPAIDLLGGRCVRLSQGRFDRATVYGDDPAELAARWVSHAIPRLHVVDLDGAKAGHPRNGEAVRRIVARAEGVPVQLGGGLRTLEAMGEALAAGVDRVVLGTAALRDAPLVREAARSFPGRVAVGIDARGGRVAVEGWLETSEVRALDLARSLEDARVAAIVYTDISRDGMLVGPDLEATTALAEGVGIPVLLSGGIASEEDLLRVAALRDRGVAGAIVGRALYNGSLDLGRALERLSCS